MPPISRSDVIVICAAIFLATGIADALAGPSLSSSGIAPATPAPIILARDDTPIDPSCLRVCTKWTGDHCDTWETKCKGDPGYPSGKAGTIKQLLRPGNAGVKAQ